MKKMKMILSDGNFVPPRPVSFRLRSFSISILVDASRRKTTADGPAGLPPSVACSRESRSSLPDRGTEKPKGNPRIQRCLERKPGKFCYIP